MTYRVTVLPEGRQLHAEAGKSLLSALGKAGLAVDAPCGGEGRCGKCRVWVDGREVPACRTAVDRDMTVVLPNPGGQTVLTQGIVPVQAEIAAREGYLLAVDMGTTTVAGYLLEGAGGRELACASMGNPQTAFGADVITRIRRALQGDMDALVAAIRDCMQTLTRELCRQAGITESQIRLVCPVGNPTMQQLLLGISPENLAAVPFEPVLTQADFLPGGDILPAWENARVLVVPDFAGFVGADTAAGILATGMAEREEWNLLVDIGTNGEMVLGNCRGMIACSAAAGPALEGGYIRFGMRGCPGAIDHVWLEEGKLRCSVLGGGQAVGICGSGLIDAVAAALDMGLVNERGKILTEDQRIRLTEKVYLTQEDIRQVQLAKGAIAAAISLMARHMGIPLEQIRHVYLAGAFGTYMTPGAACRIGLLPRELEARMEAVGNAAGSGAKMLACSPNPLELAQGLMGRAQALELAALPEFPRCFAKNMRF